MDGYILPDTHIVADFHGLIFVVEFHILGDGGDDGAGENLAVFSYSGSVMNGDVRMDVGSFTNDDVFFNGYEGVNGYVSGDLGFGVD